MITLNDYSLDAGFMGDQNLGVAELQKAMQAGQITGRDTAGQLLTQEPLKAESLEKTLKLLEYRTQDIKLWNAIPKLSAYNTVEEFVQLVSYGADRGGFYNEGELSDVEDSTYLRKAEKVKYMQVTGEVTMQAQMVRSFVDAMRKETENKMMWILRLANRSLTKGDADIIPQEFNGVYKQHASIGSGSDFLYSDWEAYYASDTVMDLRGSSLKQIHVEKGAVIIDGRYGTANTLFAPTTVLSALSQDYFADQRILQDGKSALNGIIGVVVKSIATTLGDIALMADKFMKLDASKLSTSPQTSAKAPTKPATASLALRVDATAKFSGAAEVGNAYYAVSAINRYGESDLRTVAAAVTLVAGSVVDITMTDGGGANLATGYVVYRSKITTAGSITGVTLYPIFKVSVAQLAAGYNGAAAGKIADRGYFLPDMEQAFLCEMDEDVMCFKQLAPLSKLDLAVLSMSRRFITFMFGTPQLFTPGKIVRFINISKPLTP